MFIRRTATNSGKSSQTYYTFRLVEGVRTGSAVRALQRFHTVIFLDKCEKSMEGESGVLV